jgi:tight adherence protein C
MNAIVLQWAVLAALFVTVAAASGWILLFGWPDLLRGRRLDAMVGRTPGRPIASGSLLRLMQRLRRLVESDDRHGIAARLTQAGLRSEAALTYFYAGKAALLLLSPALAWLLLPAGLAGMHRLLILLLAAVIGLYTPGWLLNHCVSRRKQRLQNALPDTLELLRVCIEAGLGFDSALTRVTRELREDCRDLQDEFGLLLLEIDAGVARGEALRRLAQRIGLDDVANLATMLIQAERFGTPISEALQVYSREMRVKRQQRAEEQAGKLAVKLLLPMGLFIFPALFCVLLGPALLRVSRQLLPVLGAAA